MRLLRPWQGFALFGTALLAGGAAPIASAHEAVSPSAGAVASSWSFDPGVLIALIFVAWLYDLGLRNLWRRYGPGRVISRMEVAAFIGAITVLVVALISPLDGLAATLFSAHMVQHMLLVLAVPPLLLLGRVDLALPAAFPAHWQRRTRRFLHRKPARGFVQLLLYPGTVWWLFAGIFWVWHAPYLYQAALHHETVHAAEHLSLLLAGLAFWHVVLHTAGQRHFGYQLAILFVFTSMLQMSILAALLTFSGDAWYPAYGAATASWNIGLLTDQRTGALVMWMTSNGVFLALIAMLFVRWFAAEERRADHYAATS
ncbi:MAG TPA: cytochrome c oxidase assembly protein [Tepidiformaceae bacterium]|nr:cytochrome c oxidase assembly protein [Tepidiformaceae bacterium]